ncbi:hypothetical protein [Schlesneria paludicola]|uniref:hypothetical protein n=1 Tax=Schlesneria paludicola TaxID=360056 RepID=UPI00029B3CF3|nr:hypothetical protein [Schlesneria paludicola]
MGEFFHGWRRKTGLLALAFTLVLLVGWGRTFSTFDRGEFASSPYVFHLIRTAKGNLCWQRLSAAAPSKWSEQWHDEAPAMFAEFASSHGERTFCLILQNEDEVNWI